MAALSPLSDIGFVTININNLKIEFYLKDRQSTRL